MTKSVIIQALLKSGGQRQVDLLKQDIAKICLDRCYSWKDTRQSDDRNRLSAEFPFSDLKPCLSKSIYAQVYLDRKWRGLSRFWESEWKDALKELGFTWRTPYQKSGQFVFATYIGIGDSIHLMLDQFVLIHSKNNFHLEADLNRFKGYWVQQQADKGKAFWPDDMFKSQWEEQFNLWVAEFS